jgi:hypothetical protein
VVTAAVANAAPDQPDTPVALPPVKASARAGGGVSVSALLKAMTDNDRGFLKGIAVTGLGADPDTGVWEYLHGGQWVAFGAVGEDSAVLLSSASRVRFNSQDGTAGGSATLTFKAWDRTAGQSGDVGVDTRAVGGLNSFSEDERTATLTITP